MTMQPLKLTSDLEDHLRQFPQARRAGHLTTREYLKAFDLFCREINPHSGERRHVSPMDLDTPEMSAVFDVLPRYKRAAMRGDLEGMQDAALTIARLVEAAAYQAATAKMTDILIEHSPVSAKPVAFLGSTEHDADYLAETLAERHADLERARDFMEEVGMRS